MLQKRGRGQLHVNSVQRKLSVARKKGADYLFRVSLQMLTYIEFWKEVLKYFNYMYIKSYI